MASLGVVGAVGLVPRARALRAPRRTRVRPSAKARVVVTARVSFLATRSTTRDVRCAGFFDNLFGGGKKTEEESGAVGAGGAEDATEDATDTAVEPAALITASVTTTESKPTTQSVTKMVTAAPQMENIKKTDYKTTMSALDALLPIDEGAVKKAEEERADALRAEQLMRQRGEKVTNSMDEGDGPKVSISPEAARALGRKKESGDQNNPVDLITRNLEKRKKQGLDGDSTKQSPIAEGDEDRWLDTVVGGLADSARKDKDDRSPEENAKLEKVLDELQDLAKRDPNNRDSDEIREKFDSLFEILDITNEPAVPPADIQKLKDEVFGYSTFWVTSVEELGPEIAGEGILIKGNLRADRLEVWATVQEKVEVLFDGKYTPFILEEPGFEGEDTNVSGTYDSGDGVSSETQKTRGPRVSFLIVPSDKAGPNPNTSLWQYIVAFILFGLTTGSAVQLGLVAEVSRLPAETAEWLARGAAGLDTTLAPGELPPGLEGFDSAAYVEGAFPVFSGIFAVAMAHEVGHTVAALARNVKISLPFLIPNGQLGTFGSITQIKSIPKTREDLFDVAIAGPIAGTTVASVLFAYGLSLSLNGDPSELLPIPAELFNGSLLLGSISQLFFGEAGQSQSGVLVHPLFVAGWYDGYFYGL